MRRLSAPIAAVALLTACAANADFNDSPPNAQQKPAFADQTRATVIAPQFAITSQAITAGLKASWGMALLPDGSFLVTDKAGRLRHVGPGGQISDPIPGLPEVDAQGQGGLLDIAIGPDFSHSR